jgi:hypothetical protein
MTGPYRSRRRPSAWLYIAAAAFALAGAIGLSLVVEDESFEEVEHGL